MATRFLEVRDLHAWYGESHILHGMSFEVTRGEVVTPLAHAGHFSEKLAQMPLCYQPNDSRRALPRLGGDKTPRSGGELGQEDSEARRGGRASRPRAHDL